MQLRILPILTITHQLAPTLTTATMAMLPLRLSAFPKSCPDPALGHRGDEALPPTLLVAEEVLLPAQMGRRVVLAHPRPELLPLGVIPNYTATV
jgi:hypothetical protein